MIRVDVASGWAALVLEIIVLGSGYPDEWNFRFRRAWRNGGRMRIHVTTEGDDPDALAALVSLQQIAWHRSGITCELCGRGAHLRIGQRYALTLCHEHSYLVGDLHPDDGKIRELHRDNQHGLPDGYDDPLVMKDDLVRMWSEGAAGIGDVMEILGLSRAEIMFSASDAGYGLNSADDPDAEEKGAEFARLLSAARDDGTRH
jgi:hypothetical protein